MEKPTVTDQPPPYSATAPGNRHNFVNPYTMPVNHKISGFCLVHCATCNFIPRDVLTFVLKTYLIQINDSVTMDFRSSSLSPAVPAAQCRSGTHVPAPTRIHAPGCPRGHRLRPQLWSDPDYHSTANHSCWGLPSLSSGHSRRRLHFPRYLMRYPFLPTWNSLLSRS